MGTWGARNLQSDCALDILGDESHALVTEIINLASSELATQFDEYDHTLLFVRFEQLFALSQHGLIAYLPSPEEVEGLKEPFILQWREYQDEEWPEREEIICATFDRFLAMCQAEQARVRFVKLDAGEDLLHGLRAEATELRDLARLADPF